MADTGLFAWLCRASICGDADVERAAEIMKDYYQGVGPEPEYDEQATTAKNAAVRFDSKVVPWNERIGRKDGVLDGVIKFAMLEEIAELRAALASRPAEVDDWQPIETAPHDQMLLLATEFDRPGDWRIKVGGYWNGGWEVFGASWTPTMWKAMPSAPSHTTNKEK